MTFTDALTAAFKDNDRITRTSWRNRDIYLCLHDHQLRSSWSSEANRIDGQMHPYIIGESDYFADDWEVVVDG